MDKICKLALIFVFAFSLPVLAAEKNLKFQWSYPSELDSVINGFKIYRADDPASPKLLVKIDQGSLRFYQTIVDLKAGENKFYVVPFIGDKEGKPSNIQVIELSPFSAITDFKTTCPKCK